jgi:hypothetical protein
MFRRAVLVAGALSLTSEWLMAQVPPEERIPILDPDRLQALGFPQVATDVYVWSKADLGGSRTRQDRTAKRCAPLHEEAGCGGRGRVWGPKNPGRRF